MKISLPDGAPNHGKNMAKLSQCDASAHIVVWCRVKQVGQTGIIARSNAAFALGLQTRNWRVEGACVSGAGSHSGVANRERA